MIGQIVFSKRMDQRPRARHEDQFPNTCKRLSSEMHFELWKRVRPGFVLDHAHEDYVRFSLKSAFQFLGRALLIRLEVDMRMIGRIVGQVHLDPPPSCEQ